MLLNALKYANNVKLIVITYSYRIFLESTLVLMFMYKYMYLILFDITFKVNIFYCNFTTNVWLQNLDVKFKHMTHKFQ